MRAACAAFVIVLAANSPVTAQDTLRAIRTAPVNNPSGDPIGRNVQHTPTLVDLGGGKLVAAFYDAASFNGSNNHLVGYAYSSDNGLTWTDGGRLPDSAKGDSLSPVLAFSKSTGAVFLLANDNAGFETIPVFKSTNAGHTFQAPVNAAPGYEGTGNSQFKPWMAVDNFSGTGAGNIYVCWNRYEGSGPSEIRFSRSTNKGGSFGPNRGRLVAAGGPGCFVTVSPNHQVSVFYIRGTGQFGQGGNNKLFMRRSLDRGLTFKPEVQVADLRTTTAGGFLQLHGRVYATSYPQAAVNPVAARPYIYVVYNDDATPANQSDDNGNLYLVRSTDAGVTWSTPARINDDLAGDQFFPNIAFVNAGERLMVSYYSRNHDPRNFMLHRRARLATLGSSGAPVFKPSFQIGPDTFPLGPTSSRFQFNYLGEYTGIAGGDGAVSTVWPDGRRPYGGRQFSVRHLFCPDRGGAADRRSWCSASLPAGDRRLGEQTTSSLPQTRAAARQRCGRARQSDVRSYVSHGHPERGSCTLIGQMVDCSWARSPRAHREPSLSSPPGSNRRDRGRAHICRDQVEHERRSRALKSGLNESHPQCHAARKPLKTITLSTGDIASSHSRGEQQRNRGGHARRRRSYIWTVDIEGLVVRVTPLVRLDFPHDEDLGIAMVSPPEGRSIANLHHLAHMNGEGANFGSGANNCSGTPRPGSATTLSRLSSMRQRHSPEGRPVCTDVSLDNDRRRMAHSRC